MKRVFTLVFSVLLAVNFTTASAQRNVYIWKKGGHLSVKSGAKTDSLTFEVGRWLFKISTSAATSVTTDKLQAKAQVAYADNVKSLSKTPEIGVCFSSTNATPTYDADVRLCLGNEVKNYDFTLYELDPGTTYYYRTYVKFEGEVFYGNAKAVTTFGEKPKYPNYYSVNGHKFVNLGLPSGLLWAQSNIGAAFSSDDGDYYAWGETETKTDYSWNTYKWGSDDNNLSKYNWSLDRKSTLDSDDDVATVKWGDGCRLPSYDDFEELQRKCDWTWEDDYNGAKGYLVTGPNGNTIFLPISGYYKNDVLTNYGKCAYYWSKSVGYNGSSYALNFANGYLRTYDTTSLDRCYGTSVRPVAEYNWWEY